MAIPALLSGVGAANANGFSKGSLMVAGQNRQKMIDAYQKDLAEGRITQQQYNANVALVNTAAQANDELPKKADGTALTTDEKANYIFSRVTEAMLTKKINSIQDAAEKKLLNKKVVDQQNYRAKILDGQIIGDDFGNEDNNPIYQVDGNDVSKADLLRIAKSEDADKYNFRITGDVETLQKFQKIQGVDKDIEAAQQEQEKQKDAELLTTLKGKVSDIEYNELLKNPESSYQYIADQALGYTRKDGERVPHWFGNQEEQTRDLYGDAIVDKAIEKYPAEKVEKPQGANGDTGTTAKLITEKENPNLNGKALVEVRDSDGNLIGNLGIHTNTGVYEKDGKRYASISGVSTTPEFRGKGRAIDLYRHALDEIKKLGFDGLYSDDAEVVDKKAINKIREKLIVEDLGNGEYLYLGVKGEKKGANGEVKPEITQEPTQSNDVFKAINDAAESKIGVRAKNIAMAKVASEYGDIGERAMVINSNFDQIVSHLKTNNKIEVRCP
jgi:predicted GNAT family acetyltransferase